ncbi:antitoxin [Rhodococcus sp. NPDC003318]|uniref:antitoxin n=1 Tax=Rhodococcus sp. NPDC003318 TaxID=3364503 RepID=UPI003678D376
MSLVDTLKGLLGKGQQYAAENSDKVEDAIDKAGDFVDKKTGGKYAEHVDKAQDAAKKIIPPKQ